MGFFDKSEPPEDEIQRAPPDQDVEKAVPAQVESAPVNPPTKIIPRAIDPELERRVVRKLDLRVPTLMGFFYLLAFLDRSNIGNAKIAGMSEDLSLTGNRYAWLLTIFYISYTLFEFQALMWKIVKPHQWATFIIFSWGLIASCQAATTNWQGMMALRFLMGAFEAGFGPGVPYLLSFFYRRHELGLRCGLFLSAAPLANTFAGALAYGITSGHASMANWRILFLVEGLPVCAAAILAWFFIPDSPSSAKFLTKEEKEVARARGLQQAGDADREGKIQWRELAMTLLDVKAWLTALMYFSCNVSFSSLPVFLPTILEQMGYSKINAQGLTAPPFSASFIVTIITPWVADRVQQRGLMIAALSLIGGVGYILCAACTTVGVRYFGVFLAACGVFPAIANILPWVLNNQGSDTRRGGGIILLNLIGQCGPFLGTNVFPDSEEPRYIKGMSICAAFMIFTTFLALVLRFLLVWENKRLDEKYGPRIEVDESKGEVPVAEDNYGASFRYML
ncbi:Major facilitator superfamily domain general substrate transporter [Penicillium malachiteum]|uniref:Major facilitator superfamily domain general substrate transporter n=1 Tax=Penicillium malachiteum TaxID=1324776 RepID=UPI002548165B|nr:Major facilitator superfamily domain general substrate transporter [Penicillium malachiteum]KAJ5720801.1 Major facilitator superfamily domain general substrate transporter [Penicillium malachiteum]